MAALVAARESAGLSQRELAKRLDRAHSFVGKYRVESLGSPSMKASAISMICYPDVAASPDVSFVRPAVDFRVAVSSLLSRIPE
jgi:transcriptional regulator with XRE-family HTH domain